MTTPLRLIFGGSNRNGHLRLSAFLSMAIFTVGPMLPWSFPWEVAAAGCFAQEWWASSDRDEEEKRKFGNGHVWWLPFGMVLKHRSIWSHGFIIGTIVRLVYGWLPLLIVLWLLSPWLLAAWCLGAIVNDCGHIALDW